MNIADTEEIIQCSQPLTQAVRAFNHPKEVLWTINFQLTGGDRRCMISSHQH